MEDLDLSLNEYLEAISEGHEEDVYMDAKAVEYGLAAIAL